MSDDAQQLAERVRDAMWAKDCASQALGMRVVAVSPGHATLTMTVREDMLNGYATCHGGLITALADSAFAFACNSHGQLTVASGLSVDFIAPARLGDLLTAAAREVAKTGRTGLYDVDVTNQSGQRIAAFRGRSHSFKDRPVIPQAPATPAAPTA